MTNFLKNKFGIYQEPRQELPSWLSKVETLSCWLSEVETLSFDYAQEPPLDYAQEPPFDYAQEPPFDYAQEPPFDYAQEPASRINTYKFPHHAYKQRN